MFAEHIVKQILLRRRKHQARYAVDGHEHQAHGEQAPPRAKKRPHFGQLIQQTRRFHLAGPACGRFPACLRAPDSARPHPMPRCVPMPPNPPAILIPIHFRVLTWDPPLLLVPGEHTSSHGCNACRFQSKKYRRAGDDHKSRATEIPGISRESRYRKMRQYEIPQWDLSVKRLKILHCIFSSYWCLIPLFQSSVYVYDAACRGSRLAVFPLGYGDAGQ